MALPAFKIEWEVVVNSEERAARLEANVAHLQSDVREIKDDIRRIDGKIDNKIDGLRQEISSNFKWLLGAYGGGVVLMMGLVYFLFSRAFSS